MVYIPPNYWLAKLRWSLIGDQEEMISTIGLTGNDPGPRDVNEVAHAVLSAWEGAFPSNLWLGVGYTLLGCDVIAGDVDGSGETGTYEEHHDGAGAAQPLPQNCALLVKKKSTQSGRENSGRMFLPAGYINEGAVSPTGEIRTADYNLLQPLLNQFMANLTDSTTAVGQPITDFAPVILHQDSSKLPTLIASLVLDRIIATQRQRMRK
jgi:hypothetical protein